MLVAWRRREGFECSNVPLLDLMVGMLCCHNSFIMNYVHCACLLLVLLCTGLSSIKYDNTRHMPQLDTVVITPLISGIKQRIVFEVKSIPNIFYRFI